eukprot:122112-Chlamydomonas_euryale.AAC.3
MARSSFAMPSTAAAAAVAAVAPGSASATISNYRASASMSAPSLERKASASEAQPVPLPQPRLPARSSRGANAGPAPSVVAPGLLLSGAETEGDATLLQDAGVTHVLQGRGGKRARGDEGKIKRQDRRSHGLDEVGGHMHGSALDGQKSAGMRMEPAGEAECMGKTKETHGADRHMTPTAERSHARLSLRGGGFERKEGMGMSVICQCQSRHLRCTCGSGHSTRVETRTWHARDGMAWACAILRGWCI